jgi:hypothetical protein
MNDYSGKTNEMKTASLSGVMTGVLDPLSDCLRRAGGSWK